MEPTNSLLLATDMQTPMCLPGRISKLLHWKREERLWYRARLGLCAACGLRPYQLDRLLGGVFGAESDEGVAAVQAAERVHHQPQVPDGPGLLEERNQLVFKQIAGNLPHEDLRGAAAVRSGAVAKQQPAGSRPTSVPTVGCGPA